jgi:putative transposase
MSRPLRVEYPGAVYHVTSRGNGRAAIYLSDADRWKFLGILADTIQKYNWLCHAYCLLDNHYHLIIETPDPNLSLGMRQLNGVYTQAFNVAHQKVGHVFQGRYKAILVEKNSHLLELCRYVVLNPVRAGMVSQPREWKWSSYTSTAYPAGKQPEYLRTDWVLGQFSEKITTARQRYRNFVADGMVKHDQPWRKLVGQIFLGSEKFVNQMQALFDDKQGVKEIPRIQRYPGRPPLARLFADIPEGDKRMRNARIVESHLTHGYTLKEIGDCLGVHYTTVSKVVREKIKK